MGGFCRHCGKELEGDEPYCPECGMPTGVQPAPYSAGPKKTDIKIAVAVVAAIAVLCIIGIAMLPSLIDTSSDEYTVTVTVNDFAVYLDDTTQYTDIASDCKIVLSLRYSYAGKTVENQILLKDGYKLNSGAVTVDEKSSVKVTGDPKDVKVTAFLLITGPGWGSASNPYYDYIDIFSVDTTKVTSGGSLYYGDSGVVFSMDDLNGDNKLELKGDCDPKGVVNITVSAVKIQK